MESKEFNLLDEPWLRLLRHDGEVCEASLTEALLNADRYRDLSGELPTQDFAVLRPLLALVYAVVMRKTPEDEDVPLWESDDIEDAEERWLSYWRLGRFPEKPFRDYFARWHERFWLFEEERPFYQSPGAFKKLPEGKKATEYSAAKLNGAIAESGNEAENKNPRIFTPISGEGKYRLSYAEAARWLIYLNAFDDSSGKPVPKGQDMPATGVGWLGKIGSIYLVGANLFETLMLNLILLKNGEAQWQEAPKPIWELDKPRDGQRIQISVPDNLAELLTLQSRRLLLGRTEGAVTSYVLLGGDFFSEAEAAAEQFTLWKNVKQSKYQPDLIMPKLHDESRQIWRDFGAVFLKNPNIRQPGVIVWYQRVMNLINLKMDSISKYRIVSVKYDDKKCSIIDSFSDSLEFHTGLITKMDKDWKDRIAQEVSHCEDLGDAIAYLALNLNKASGLSVNGKNRIKVESGIKKSAAAQFYSRIDLPFRRWLRSVDPATEEAAADEKLHEWHKEAKSIAARLGSEMVAQAGENAFTGRTLKEKIKGKDYENHYSAPEAYNSFTWRINRIYEEG